jgi:hypothetical protein
LRSLGAEHVKRKRSCRSATPVRIGDEFVRGHRNRLPTINTNRPERLASVLPKYRTVQVFHSAVPTIALPAYTDCSAIATSDLSTLFGGEIRMPDVDE